MNPYTPPSSPEPDRKLRRRRFLTVALCMYVIAYAGLSRNGFAKSDAMGINGMWFFTPDDGEHWRIPHYTCVIVFAPLIAIDNLLGTGRSIGAEPTWTLSSTGGQHGFYAGASGTPSLFGDVGWPWYNFRSSGIVRFV